MQIAARFLVRKPDDLTDRERGNLVMMLGYAPELCTLRRFVVQVYELFDPEQSSHQAQCRRAVLVKDPAYQADPDLGRAWERGSMGCSSFLVVVHTT